MTLNLIVIKVRTSGRTNNESCISLKCSVHLACESSYPFMRTDRFSWTESSNLSDPSYN